jgi:hypothetical protein
VGKCEATLHPNRVSFLV